MFTAQELRHRIPVTVERLWLVPFLESDDVQPFALHEGEIQIGSSPENDLCLPIAGVDPHHCAIRLENRKATLTAYSRMTWLDHGPVRSAVLKAGQRLTIGPVEFRLEQRTESSGIGPLEHVELIRHLLAQELSGSQAPIHLSPKVKSEPTETQRISTVPSTRVHHGPALSPSRDKQTELAIHDLERRTRLIEELKGSIQDQSLALLKSHRDELEFQKEARSELEARRQEFELEQAQLREERTNVERLRIELEEKRSTLSAAEQLLETNRVEVKQLEEQVTEHRQEQFQREELLQQRIEEVNEAEAALATREADLLERERDLERRQADLAATSDESAALLAVREAEWTKQRAELESSLCDLRALIQTKDAQLSELRAHQTEYEQELNQRDAELARLTAEFEKKSSQWEREKNDSLQEVSSVEERSRSLSELETRLQSERELLDGDRRKCEEQQRLLEETESRLTAERSELEQLRDELTHRNELLRLKEQSVAMPAESSESPDSSAREELEAIRKSLQEERLQIQRDQSELQSQQAAIEAAHTEIAQTREHLDVRETRLESVREDLEQLQRSLEETQDRLNQDAAHVREQEAELTAARNALQREQLSLQDQFAELDALREQLKAESDRLQSTAHAHFHATQSDAFEVYESAPRVDTDSDDEIVDDFAEARISDVEGENEYETEEDQALRSHIAELFGMSSDELNARARSHSSNHVRSSFDPQNEIDGEEPISDSLPTDEIEETSEPENINATATLTNSGQVGGSSELDPIDAYMKELLARSRGSAPGPSTPVTVSESEPAQPRDQRVERQPSIASPSDQPSLDAPSVSESPTPTKRKRPDSTLERANIDAFRDLANLSARSAVAKYNSSSLRNRLVAFSIITVTLVVVWIVLITAHFWTGESFITWGLLTAAAICACTLQTLKTHTQIRSNVELQGGDSSESTEDPLMRFIQALAGIAARLSITRSGKQPRIEEGGED